jgi:hypothetical protein
MSELLADHRLALRPQSARVLGIERIGADASPKLRALRQFRDMAILTKEATDLINPGDDRGPDGGRRIDLSDCATSFAAVNGGCLRLSCGGTLRLARGEGS